MESRKVEYFELFTCDRGGLERRVAGTAIFLGWGVEGEEVESGCLNYTAAILELEDGNVITVYAGNIRFIDRG